MRSDSSQAASAAAVQQQQSQEHQQHGQQQAQPSQALAHACPPFGSKSVIGRRAKMEDACVAVPYLVEVPVSHGGMDELLPPRIAPQLRTGSGAGSSAHSQQTAMAASGDSSGSGAAFGSSGRRQQQQHSREPGSGAMAMDAAGSGALAAALATETLHFFGVFDGHGGADAALHCAKCLHERVRDVLSACAASLSGNLAALRDKDRDESATHQAGQPGTQASTGSADEAASPRPPTAGSGRTDCHDAGWLLAAWEGLACVARSGFRQHHAPRMPAVLRAVCPVMTVWQPSLHLALRPGARPSCSSHRLQGLGVQQQQQRQQLSRRRL
jgi:hypothetical protein